MSPNRLFAFEPYRLDLQERQLLRGTEAVPLPPKLFDLLAVLVQNPGSLLQKEDLLERVWGNVAVEEGSLTRGISSLRQALGSPPDGRDYIQTVAKRGYRFTASVRETTVTELDSTRFPGGIPLPPLLVDTDAPAFVGRDAELARMQDVWQRAKNGPRQLLLVTGEPGIGKTRLALEFARACGSEGATVLLGYSDEEALVSYQPFVEALSRYVRACPVPDLRAQLAAAGGGTELALLIPALLHRVPDLATPQAVNPDGQRYRLFEAVSALLAVASSARPMLLVFDDLHWADHATLLLRHVMRSSDAASLAIVATYRESELGRTHPLADMLIKFRREGSVTRLRLRGLECAHVRGLVDTIAGSGAPSHIAEIVTDSTDGNPFFATEMLRHLQETGAIARLSGSPGSGVELADAGLSAGIKEVIGRRLSRLSEACNSALGIAAVIGREFDVAVLEAVADLADDTLLDALEEAVRAQLVSESREVGGRFAFRHALVRETLHGELSSPRRAKLHRRVAEAIERLTHDTPDPPLADLAYHFTQAASAGTVDRAIDYATRAGNRAADALAHEEAARFFEMALHAFEFRPARPDTDGLRGDLHARRARAFDALGEWRREIPDLVAALRYLDPQQVERRCELLLALARAWFLLLDIRPVEQYATEALQLADRVQRADLAANAIAWLARCRQAAGDLGGAIDLDRRALSRAPGVTTAAHMMGPLTLYLAGRSMEALALAGEAADSARSSRDTTFILYSLSHLGLNLTATGRYAQALDVFREARGFGRKYGAIPMLARATAMEAGLHLTLFDFEGAEALQAEACELARRVGFAPPIISAGIDSLLTFARRHEPGRAERLLEETTAAVASTGDWHEWLWQMRLTQARAELALARGAFDPAIAGATEAIDRSRARGRPKYETLGLITRAHARHALTRTPAAIADARCAVGVAGTTGDPAVLLLALDALLAVDGADEVAAQALAVCNRIDEALPGEMMRRCFAESEVVQRIRRSG